MRAFGIHVFFLVIARGVFLVSFYSLDLGVFSFFESSCLRLSELENIYHFFSSFSLVFL